MAANGNENGQFQQGNAAAGFQAYNQYYPGYGAAFTNPYGQWPGYGYPYMPPQYPAPPMAQFPGMAPGYFTPPPPVFPDPGLHGPPVQ